MITKLIIETPTHAEILAENISASNATLLILAYVEERGDVDARFVDEEGESHPFDFGSEVWGRVA